MRRTAAWVAVAVVAACSGMATDTVTTSGVASISITPPTTTLVVGSQTPLQALVQDATGKTVSGADVFWSIQDTTVATISDAGIVTGVAPGSTQAAASANGKSGLATITVSRTPVSTVVVTPPHADAAPGGKTQFTAVAYDASQNVLPDRAIIWSTSNAGVATVGASGVVSAVGPGLATITATSEGKSGVGTIAVSQAAVATVAVTPTPLSMTVGQTTQLAATLADSAGNVLSGRTVAWSTSNPAVATVSAQGVVTAVAQGIAAITATSEGKSGTASLTVTNVAVGSVVVQPQAPSIAVGTSVQLSVTVRDVNGNLVTDRVVTWSSSSSAIATVTTAGLVTGVGHGNAVITATSEGKSGTTTVTVTGFPVGSVVVSPATKAMLVTQNFALSVTVKDSLGTVVTDRPVSWSSSNASVATVSSTGVVTAIAPGSATITAKSETKSGTCAVTVTPVPVSSVAVQPARDTIFVSKTVQLTAVPQDSAGNALSGRTVTWASNNGLVATVSSTGLVTATALGGNATITATSEGKSGTSAVMVVVPIATVVVSPATKTIVAGDNASFTATTRDASGNPLSGRVLLWSSSNPSVATVSATGVATGTGIGVATITATAPLEGKSGSATLTVTAASVSVTPSPDSTYVGQSATMTATARDKNGNPVPAQGFSWSSSGPSVATVSQSGVVTGVSAGSATIVATLSGLSANATFKVLAPVASVAVTPSNPPAITAGTSIVLQAALKDGSNKPIGPGRVVTWTSSDGTVVTITPTAGNYSASVKGTKAGTVTITATSEGKTGTATITVKN